MYMLGLDVHRRHISADADAEADAEAEALACTEFFERLFDVRDEGDDELRSSEERDQRESRHRLQQLLPLPREQQLLHPVQDLLRSKRKGSDCGSIRRGLLDTLVTLNCLMILVITKEIKNLYSERVD